MTWDPWKRRPEIRGSDDLRPAEPLPGVPPPGPRGAARPVRHRRTRVAPSGPRGAAMPPWHHRPGTEPASQYGLKNGPLPESLTWPCLVASFAKSSLRYSWCLPSRGSVEALPSSGTSGTSSLGPDNVVTLGHPRHRSDARVPTHEDERGDAHIDARTATYTQRHACNDTHATTHRQRCRPPSLRVEENSP